VGAPVLPGGACVWGLCGGGDRLGGAGLKGGGWQVGAERREGGSVRDGTLNTVCARPPDAHPMQPNTNQHN